MSDEPLKQHVMVPTGLYNEMAACFYGNGPTYWQLKGKMPPMNVPAPKERFRVEEEDEDIGLGDIIVPKVIEQPTYVPFGAAVPRSQ